MISETEFGLRIVELLEGLGKLDDLRGQQIADLQLQVTSLVCGMQAVTEAYALRTELDDLRLEIRDLTPREAA